MQLLCCIKPAEDIKVLDFRHCGLSQLPNAVFNAERTIESLHIDANQIKALPRELFHCHGLKHLTLSDNEITSIPPAISSLTNIEQLDVSKNGIVDLPDNLKNLKQLKILNASVNPLGKLPDGFTQLLYLTHLCLNDCFLEYLPGNFGRLSGLKILELRENHLKTLPQSLSRLTELERLDIGCNEFTEMPGVIGNLYNLLELWCDSNQMTSITRDIGKLKQLMYFDACKNRIEELPDEIDGCISLSDLYLSTNLLKQLPHSIGRLSNMTTLKIDDNQLQSLPSSIGGLVSLSELDVSANDLEELPPTIGLLRHLRTLIADENFLSDIPCELGSCYGLTVLSVRSNKLTYIPDEIGRIPRLRVLNLSDNEINNLPYSLMNLKELQALWLAENQSKPLLRLQSEIDSETGRRSLTCYLLPQQRMDPIEAEGDDNQSFHPSLWEEIRQQRQQIQFQDNGPNDHSNDAGAAYPKEMRIGTKHMRNEAIRKQATGDVHSNEEAESTDGVLLGSSGELNSPKTSTHRLFKLEKERSAKDKARINRHSQEINPDEIVLVNGTRDNQPRHDSKTNAKERQGSKQMEWVEDMKTAVNGETRRLTGVSDYEEIQDQPKRTPSIQSGHYKCSPSVVSSHSQRHEQLSPISRQSESHMPIKLIDRQPSFSASISGPSTQTPPTDGHVQSIPKIPHSNSNSAVVNETEDHFGVFISNEDPKLYEQRFKYYQRVRKHRKNIDVRSDLGYYGNYDNTSTKPSSDSGQRSHGYRRPLQNGKDGHERWELHSQRSVGDGYASDIEGYSYGKRFHHIPNYMQSPFRPSLHRKDSSSKNSGVQNDVRPPVPPPYDTAVASKTELRSNDHTENTPFPPPPPYKPPVRDMKPDGASNDGAPRSSPTMEISQDVRDGTNFKAVPFQSYSIQRRESNSQWNSYLQDSTTSQANSSHARQESNIHSRVHRTPSNSSYTNSKHPFTQDSVKKTQAYRASSYTPSSQSIPHQLYDRSGYLSRTLSATPNLSGNSNYAYVHQPLTYQNSASSSNYSTVYQQEKPEEASEYMMQISKSLGRLGYTRDSKKLDNQYNNNMATAQNHLSTPKNRYSSNPQNESPDIVTPHSTISKSTPSLQINTTSSRKGSFQHRPQLYTVLPSSNTYSNGYLINNEGSYPLPPPELTQLHVTRSQPGIQYRQANALYHQQTVTQSEATSSYMPPPNRKSPRLPHRVVPVTGLQVEHLPSSMSHVMNITIVKNPGLGFSVAGGTGSQGNPFKPMDEGIFVSKVTSDGPAANLLQPGDRILTLNKHDFTHMEHGAAVSMLKKSPAHVTLTIERMMPTEL